MQHIINSAEMVQSFNFLGGGDINFKKNVGHVFSGIINY